VIVPPPPALTFFAKADSSVMFEMSMETGDVAADEQPDKKARGASKNKNLTIPVCFEIFMMMASALQSKID